jgi:hypothetical protein
MYITPAMSVTPLIPHHTPRLSWCLVGWSRFLYHIRNRHGQLSLQGFRASETQAFIRLFFFFLRKLLYFSGSLGQLAINFSANACHPTSPS